MKGSINKKLPFYLYILQALFGYLGFLTWQEDTQEVIVNNIEGLFKIAVNLILVAKALLSYPLPFFAACDLLEKEMFQVIELSY